MKHQFHRLTRALAGILTRHGTPRPPTRKRVPVRGRQTAERIEEKVVSQQYDFDDLAKDLASGLPRREVLRRLGQSLIAGLAASLGIGIPGVNAVDAAPTAAAK